MVSKMERVRVVGGWWHVLETSSQGGCGGAVGQERSKFIVILCCCNRDVWVESFYFLHTRWSGKLKHLFEDEEDRAWRGGDKRAGTRAVDWWHLRDKQDASRVRYCVKLRTPTASRGFLKATTECVVRA